MVTKAIGLSLVPTLRQTALPIHQKAQPYFKRAMLGCSLPEKDSDADYAKSRRRDQRGR
jgi:hypothetical protein